MSNPPVYFRSKKNQAKKELTQYFYNNTVYSYCAKQFRVCEHLLHTPQRSCDVVIINKTNTKHYTAVCHAECITNDKITTKVCKHKHDIKTENKQGARTDLNKTKNNKRKKKSTSATSDNEEKEEETNNDNDNNNNNNDDEDEDKTEDEVILSEEEKQPAKKAPKTSNSRPRTFGYNTRKKTTSKRKSNNNNNKSTENSDDESHSNQSDFDISIDDPTQISTAVSISQLDIKSLTSHRAYYYSYSRRMPFLKCNESLREFIRPLISDIIVNDRRIAELNPVQPKFKTNEFFEFPHWMIFDLITTRSSSSEEDLMRIFEAANILPLETLKGTLDELISDTTCMARRVLYDVEKLDSLLYIDSETCRRIVQYEKSGVNKYYIARATENQAYLLSEALQKKSLLLINCKPQDVADKQDLGSFFVNYLPYFVGSKLSQAPPHTDSIPLFNVCLTGTKLWIMYDVREVVNTFPGEWLNVRDKLNANQLLQLRSLTMCIQQPGQIIVVQPWCVHSVINLSHDTNAGIAIPFITAKNFPALVQFAQDFSTYNETLNYDSKSKNAAMKLINQKINAGIITDEKEIAGIRNIFQHWENNTIIGQKEKVVLEEMKLNSVDSTKKPTNNNNNNNNNA